MTMEDGTSVQSLSLQTMAITLTMIRLMTTAVTTIATVAADAMGMTTTIAVTILPIAQKATHTTRNSMSALETSELIDFSY